MEGRLQFALRACSGCWAMMKEAVGQRPAELFVEEHEQERGLGSFVAEPVGVAAAVSFHQAVGFHLAQIVAETRHSTISSRVRPFTALTAVERLAVRSKAPN